MAGVKGKSGRRDSNPRDGAGRKPLPEGEGKDLHIQIKVNQKIKDLLKEKAEQDPDAEGNVSKFMLKKALGKKFI